MNRSHEINTSQFRVQSVDVLPGVVMIIMAIDHVRVYSGILPGGLPMSIFFTRWITHFCAPAFAFLAGTSAFLYFQKCGSRSEVAIFLFSRGLILVCLELVAVRFFWMFNLDLATFTFTGVIWMLGWCMVILSAFLWMRPMTVAIIGLIVIFCQQMFSYLPVIFPSSIQGPLAKFWEFFYPAGTKIVSRASRLPGIPPAPYVLGISIFYTIIPWIGIMMAGYGFGKLLRHSNFRKIALTIGLTSIAAFILVGVIFGTTSAPNDAPFLLKLLGQQKYPPTQMFLLMTLGPVIALAPWAEKAKGWLVDALKIVGRVPMFYYLLHILLIHVSALIVNLIHSGSTHQEWYTNAPFVLVQDDQRWELPILYLVWLMDVVILFFACRWYAPYKYNHPEQAWTKYL